MKTFYLYDSVTGQILQAGSVPDSQFASQARNGTVLVEGVADVFEHYVNTSTGSLVRVPVRPSPHHHFDYTAKKWVVDAGYAWERVRAERDKRIAASDWVALRAADQGQPVPPDWLAYRQALRDVTEQADPGAIVWPEPPTG